MTSSYKSRAEATDDRACLELMREALNAAHNAVRLDECRLWTVRGSRGYVSTWGDGQTWMLAVGSKTPRHWTFAKQRMAAFPGLAQLTQDGDEEGVFRLMRLPTPEEAAEIRRAAGIRQSPGSTSAGRRFTPAKTGDTATSMRFGERPVPDPVPDAERIHDADGGRHDEAVFPLSSAIAGTARGGSAVAAQGAHLRRDQTRRFERHHDRGHQRDLLRRPGKRRQRPQSHSPDQRRSGWDRL